MPVCQLSAVVQALFLALARYKNVSGPTASAGGSPGGDGGGDPPRRLSAAEKGKGKKLVTKKRKASDREVEIAETVAAFMVPVTTTERLSSSVASSEQLAPSSTVPETSAIATESVPASSAGLEQPA